MSHLGAELGAAIRTIITRLHRSAPSRANQNVSVIETRLKPEEYEIPIPWHTMGERL